MIETDINDAKGGVRSTPGKVTLWWDIPKVPLFMGGNWYGAIVAVAYVREGFHVPRAQVKALVDAAVDSALADVAKRKREAERRRPLRPLQEDYPGLGPGGRLLPH